MDSVDLYISFEGSVHGLEEGRLSIASFGGALTKLLKAYRRIASGIVKDALARPGYGEAGGKYAREASSLDFELSTITHQSPVTVVLRCTSKPMPMQQPPLFQDELLAEAGQTLLRSIDLESRGHLRNAYVRRYLEALPMGIERQEYKLSKNSHILHSTVVGEVRLAEQTEWPILDIISANVVGVGFEPGNSEVRVKPPDAKPIAMSASPEMVDMALDLRGALIEATVWKEAGRKARLVGLVPSAASRRGLSHEENKRLLFEEWDGLLRRLSR